MEKVIAFFWPVFFGLLSLVGLGFGYVQNRKSQKERESKVDSMKESAHELAKKEVTGKSLESLVADANKLYPSGRSDDSESR